MKNKSHILLLVFSTITYILMVVTNSLANILPINQKGTGEISDSYPNLFAPAGVTFAIWGLIYLLLFLYSIYQFFWYYKANPAQRTQLYRINLLFSISSLANIAWIFAWHYEIIWLSLILMFLLLVCLIKINLILKEPDFFTLKSLPIRLPFTVYFGWITIATIANITVFLVAIKWNRFSLSEVFWTNLIVIIGAIIGCICILSYKSIAYGLVILWAYFGIIVKHTSPEQFNGRYPSVIVSVTLSMVLVTIVLLFLFISRLLKRRNSSNN